MFHEEIEKLEVLAESLKKTKDLGEKQEILLTEPRVQEAILSELKAFLPACSDLSSKNALFAIAAINQHRRVLAYPKPAIPREKIRSLLSVLTTVDKFYESIGGIVGYQLLVLKFLKEEKGEKIPFSFSKAPHIDLLASDDKVLEYGPAGFEALSEMGEIYPIGGLGSRLSLKSKNGEPLPAAMLLFCGRTLLEGMIRDLQAREFCYFRLFGKQVTVPVALMTSKEKQNDARIYSLCEKKKWFSRPKESFFLFSQASVPVIAKNGKWSLKAPLEPELQPGGHGALWRTAEEKGVFLWFLNQEKHRLLVRQINNPIAGLDNGLLVLMGAGKKENKAFGFACCERLQNAAEGALVLIEEKENYRISNIEYTDFKKYGVEAKLTEEAYPANTNILYADLHKLLPHIKKNPLPGLVLNMKSKISIINENGTQEDTLGGRLESMMQNISDALVAKKGEPLATFLTYNKREKTISATKRSYEKDLLETPEGAFYDLLSNAHELLEKICKVSMPPFFSQEDYVKKGPSFLFLYHPALGPLYSLIAQKIKGGKLAKNSELQLEIADVILENVDLEGSLLIQAENVLGTSQQGIVRYSQKTGKCILKNVKVQNKGMILEGPSCFWKNSIKRHESLKIILQGHSEFYAENVTFEGGGVIVVPENERWVAAQGKDGRVQFEKQKPNWCFQYKLKENEIRLKCENLLSLPLHG